MTSAFEITGGPTTGLTFTSSEAFRSKNYQVFAAVNNAFVEALVWVNADKRRAAKLYIEMAQEKKPREDDIAAIISSKDMEYTKVPRRFGQLIEFMHRTGYVKNKPAGKTCSSKRPTSCPEAEWILEPSFVEGSPNRRGCQRRRLHSRWRLDCWQHRQQ